MQPLITILREVRDPRDINARHEVGTILFLALAATLCGAKSCVAIRRALFLMALAALLMVMVALDTASISAPTLNGSRMLLPTNCAANAGGSIEKSPYGS